MTEPYFNDKPAPPIGGPIPPIVKLCAEYACDNPPSLLGFHIIVDGKTIAVVPADEVERFTASFGDTP